MQIYKNKTQISKPQNTILHTLIGGGNSLIIYNLRKKNKLRKQKRRYLYIYKTAPFILNTTHPIVISDS